MKKKKIIKSLKKENKKILNKLVEQFLENIRLNQIIKTRIV